MTTTDPTIVVVVEEKKKPRALLWAAGAAVATLMLGGSTFALWSANAGFGGGTITAGDLNLVQTLDTAYYDVSDDREDATTTVPGTDGSQPGHIIEAIADWRIVPGDKVAAAFSADITLEGDNLVAKLSLTGLSAMEDENDSMTWTYEVYQDEALLLDERDLPGDGTLFYLSAPETGQAAGAEDAFDTTVYPMSAVTEDFTIVIYGAFDAEAGEAGKSVVDSNGIYEDQTTDATGTRQDATMTSVLAQMKLQLEQVRDTGLVFK